MSAPGIFISIEGGEGAGKSTQARRLAEAVRQTGREVVLTREPGGTPGAEAIRALLLDPATALLPLADTFLHFAARADHAARVIRPALARGAVVICDRFIDSTLAYQGYGLGVPLAQIHALIGMIGLIPDVTFVLQVSEAVAEQRLTLRRQTADRYERLDRETMARIAAGFEAIAAAEPARCRRLNAAADEDAVFAQLIAVLREKFGLP